MKIKTKWKQIQKLGNRGLMKIQYARSKLKCIKLNLDTAENGENKKLYK